MSPFSYHFLFGRPMGKNYGFRPNSPCLKAWATQEHVHFKPMFETGRAIKGMNAYKAISYLEQVIEHQTAVPFFRYNEGVAHHKQGRELGCPQTKWPEKACKLFIKLIKNALSNLSQFPELDGSKLIIANVQCNRGAMQRYRRIHQSHGRVKSYASSPTNVQIVLAEQGQITQSEGDIHNSFHRHQGSYSYCRTVSNRPSNLSSFSEVTVHDVPDIVEEYKGDINGPLRCSIIWNDLDYDQNDLDNHCMQPNGHEIKYSRDYDSQTTGKLDVDNTHPKRGEVACENITWEDINKMPDGDYQFFVHQYDYRGGNLGFRAQIAFDGHVFNYDYRQKLEQGEKVNIACVTLKNGHFSIAHGIQPL